MNIVDAMAIAPYYIDLFFMPAPDLEPPSNEAAATTPQPQQEEENALGNVGKIMQVRRKSFKTAFNQ